jgi:hypothetical protein
MSVCAQARVSPHQFPGHLIHLSRRQADELAKLQRNGNEPPIHDEQH